MQRIKQKTFYVDQQSALKLPSIAPANEQKENFRFHSNKKFQPDPEQVFKEFPSKCKKQTEEKLVTQKLDGEQLM